MCSDGLESSPVRIAIRAGGGGSTGGNIWTRGGVVGIGGSPPFRVSGAVSGASAAARVRLTEAQASRVLLNLSKFAPYSVSSLIYVDLRCSTNSESISLLFMHSFIHSTISY